MRQGQAHLEYLPLSKVNTVVYCARRFYLEYVLGEVVVSRCMCKRLCTGGIPACRLLAREDLPICARGYMRKRLTGPLVGDPTAPCRGLSPAMARACSEVQGLRLVEEEVSRPMVVCEAMPYPEVCALYVGRAAFTLLSPLGAARCVAVVKGAR